MSVRLDRHRPKPPTDRLLLGEPPGSDALPLDVAIVGAGPAGLSAAVRLARAARESGSEISIGVLEKAAALGEQCLSGAVVNPAAFRDLLPDLDEDAFPFRGRVEGESVRFLTRRRSFPLPVPPTMRNRGCHVASISEIVRFLGARAEESGIEIFPGFAVASLLEQDGRIVGLRTVAAGARRDGSPGPAYEPATDVAAKVTILAEGARGPLGQAVCARFGIGSPSPQIFALGVKELWRSENPVARVVHTMGHPLPRSAFGGGFLYPMGDGLTALGLVVGLDAPSEALDVHRLLQDLKEHPLVRPHLDGGDLLEWGARLIPEGGLGSLPERFSAPGVLLSGDTAGFVDVPSLKGIHYAMWSGMLAADAASASLRAGVPLSLYDASLRSSTIFRDLHRTRNMRPAFQDGFWRGVLVSGIATLSGGLLPRGTRPVRDDAERERAPVGSVPPPPLKFAKLDGVFRSGNNTRDDIPSHLVVPEDVPAEVAKLWERMCPAGVYEAGDDGLGVNPANCVDCRATDVLGPRWTPREGGSGTRWRRM